MLKKILCDIIAGLMLTQTAIMVGAVLRSGIRKSTDKKLFTGVSGCK